MFPGTRAQTTTAQWFDAAECRAESDIFTQQNIKLEVKHCVCLQQRRIKHAGQSTTRINVQCATVQMPRNMQPPSHSSAHTKPTGSRLQTVSTQTRFL